MPVWMPVCNRIGGDHEFGSHHCQACATNPTAQCLARVKAEYPRLSKADVLLHIVRANRLNLICLDCGSENHTRGHELCNYEAP